MIENQLERIAVALEAIASMGTMPAAVKTPQAPADTGAETEELTPQQKAARTRKANAEKKKQAELAAQQTQPGNVTPINTTSGPAANAPAGAADPSLAEIAYQIPATLQELQQLANDVFQQLGPRGNEIGEVLAGTYQCSSLSALAPEYYAGFARDISALVNK